MTRVRFDPGFLDDPRWDRLGIDAYVLHTKACAYVVHTLSDGFVPEARAATLAPLIRRPKQVIAALVGDGVWMVVDGGYIVCSVTDDLRFGADRGDEQPSRAFVEGERERTRQRVQKHRQKRNGDGNGVTNGVRNAGGNGVSNGSRAVGSSAVQEPTVPVPALLADDDPGAVCEHGTPNGRLLTSAGSPRCPMCRHLTIVQDDEASA